MGIFSSILNKLGFGDSAAPAAPAADSPAPVTEVAVAAAPAPAPAAPVAISEVDVVSRLDNLAGQHSESLNWKVSIVDLLKLLDLDSSLTARKHLATELSYPGDVNGDSASMNMWLHKAVLRKLAENGGNVPQSLLA